MFTPSEYLRFAAMSFGYFILFLSPIVYAAVVANLPTKLAKRLRFALVCGALSYGSGILVEAALSPIQMIAIFLAPSWDDAGYTVAPQIFNFAAEYSYVASYAVGILVAVWLPIHMRRRIWSAVYPSDT